MPISFRSHKEMHEIYGELEELPARGRPYCITFHTRGRYVGFIGTSHTNDPKNSEWP